MGRSDDMTRVYRGVLGIGRERGAECRVAPDGPAPDEAFVRGLEVVDIDRLLREHEEGAFWRGKYAGEQEAEQRMRRQHDVELGEFVGAAFSFIESEVLSRVVLAAVTTVKAKGTRQQIVDAVVGAVKGEAAALNEMGRRARTGELFS